MTRRSTSQGVDHARDRQRWRGLVAAVHATVEVPKATALDALAAQALKARDFWNIPAPYPRGLVAGPLWSLSLMYGRTADAAQRERIAPMLLAVAGMMDELLAEVGATVPVQSMPPFAQPEAARRLPYAEN